MTPGMSDAILQAGTVYLEGSDAIAISCFMPDGL